MCVGHVYKMYLRFRTFICSHPLPSVKVVSLKTQSKLSFKSLIVHRGYSERAADELWKWYDFTSKKGVASF
jgi:hypothetical protein